MDLTEQLGSDTFVYCSSERDEESCVVRNMGQFFMRPGEAVGLRIPWDNAHFFDSDTGESLSSRPG